MLRDQETGSRSYFTLKLPCGPTLSSIAETHVRASIVDRIIPTISRIRSQICLSLKGVSCLSFLTPFGASETLDYSDLLIPDRFFDRVIHGYASIQL